MARRRHGRSDDKERVTRREYNAVYIYTFVIYTEATGRDTHTHTQRTIDMVVVVIYFKRLGRKRSGGGGFLSRLIVYITTRV